MQLPDSKTKGPIRSVSRGDLLSGATGSDKLQRKIPRNPKFQHVHSTLDTGAHAGNVRVKVDRSGEIFRRINRRQLNQLMTASEEGDESIFALQQNWDEVDDNDDLSSVHSGVSRMSSSSMSSTISQPVVATHSQHLESKASQNGEASDHYLLLDMREDDDAFNKYHIQGAMHYTPAMLRRDYFPPQLFKFKHASDKLIVVYDSDDTSRIGLDASTLFVQKGFANIFLLTGGIKHFMDRYPRRLVGMEAAKIIKQIERAEMMKTQGGKHGDRSGSVANRTSAMAGTPSASRLLTTQGGSSTMVGGRGGVSQRGYTPSVAGSSHSQSTSMSFARGGQGQSYTGTTLNRPVAVSHERESPRVVLSRLQQQQQQQHPSQHARQSSSSGSSSSSASMQRGRTPISSGPFR